MTIPSDQVFAYHIGIVVRSIEETGAIYKDLLGVPEWHSWEVEREGLPTNPATAGKRGGIRIAYGRAPGQTIELLQPTGGTTIWSEFLREHGEGVQHLGVWTPDLPAALAAALARGAKVTHGMLRDGTASVQLSAGSPPEALLPALDPDQLAYVTPTAGGVQIEYVGPGGPARMREMIGQDFDNVVTSPPWLSVTRS
ncbi:MAG TPA: VOC family protein [Dehalococcoidia bacterium]|nr:VOC family protein [Dehalococcoidia bacterium]